MATTLLTIDNRKVKLRWEEEYVSEGLNEKMLGIIPGGIIRGGLLEPHPSAALTLRVKADPVYGDIVASYEDVNGRQMTVNLGSGDVDLDLSALANTTVYIAIYVEYSLLADTTAEWRAYTQAQLDGAPEADRLIIWGSVDVPASGVIPAANIHQESRRDARWRQSSGTLPWVPIIRNGGFEGRLAHWEAGTPVGSVTFTFSEVEYYRGNRSLEVAATGAGSVAITQQLMFPCGAGQLLYLRFMSKANNWTGDIELQARFYDKDGSYLGSETLRDNLSAGTHDWEEHAGVFVAPSSAVFVEPQVYISASGSGTNAWMDDVQMFVQTDVPSNLQRPDTSMTRNDRLYKLVFGDSTTVPPVVDPNDFRVGKTASDTLGIEFLGSGTGVFSLDSSLYLQPQNDVLPDPTESHGLGSTTARWADIWGNNLWLFDSADGPLIEWFDESGVGTYNVNRWRMSAANGSLSLQRVSDAGTAFSLVFLATYDSGLGDYVVDFYRPVRTYDVYPISDSAYSLGSTSIRWLSFFSDQVDTHELIVSGGVGQGCRDLIPYSNGAEDLGSASYRWRDLWIDGVATIDELVLGTGVGQGIGGDVYPDANDSRRLGYVEVGTPGGTNDRLWSEVGAETIRCRGLNPELILFDTSEVSNEKGWSLYGGNDLYLAVLNDNEVVGAAALRVLRGTGATVDRIDFYTDIFPVTDETYSIGSSAYRWNQIFLASGGVDIWDNEISHGRWQLTTGSTYIYLDSLTDAGVYADHALFFQKNTSDDVFRAVFGANAQVEISSSGKTNGLMLKNSYTPVSSTESGVSAGNIRWDANYIYVRVDGSTWKRVALNAF